MTTTIIRSPRTITQTRTNLCPNPVPASTAGWIGAGPLALGTMSDGTPSVQMTTSTTTTPYLFTPSVPSAVASGDTYVLSAIVEILGDTTGALYNVRAHGLTGNVYFSSGATTLAAGGPPKRVTVVCTTSAAVAAGEFHLSIVGPASVLGAKVRVGNVLIEKAATFGGYFDGNTPPTPLATSAWTGTANASTSIQQISNPGEIFIPKLMTGYQATRVSGNGSQYVPGRADPAVSYRVARLRSGSLTFVLGDESQASAFDALMSAATKFVLTDTDRPVVGMAFALPENGVFRIALDPETQDVFTAEFDFMEVTP